MSLPNHKERKLRILFAAPEVDPFVKAGGLADVARALPLALKKLGHDVRIVMPQHYRVDEPRHHFKTLIEKTAVQMDSERINFSVKETRLNTIPIYIVDNKGFFRSRSAVYGYVDDSLRFAFFCKALLKIPELIEWKPDIVHANDWLTGLVSNYLKTSFKKSETYKHTKAIFTIHNLSYQGTFNRLTLRPEEIDSGGSLPKYNTVRFNTVNFMKRGIIYSDAITTVSKQYAKEIVTSQYGEGLDPLIRERQSHLIGITNGVDYKKFNPAKDHHIYQQYSAKHLSKKSANKIALQKEFGLFVDKNIPLIGMASRLSPMKGYDLVQEILRYLLEMPCQIIIVGEGDPKYHKLFWNYSKKYPKKFATHLQFDRIIARKVYAASDMFLMPSRFEPCGIGQLISSRYGSVPIVRATGGLKDTIQDYSPENEEGNGFVFEKFRALDLFRAIVRALETYKHKDAWKALVKKVMKLEFSWDKAAKEYLKVYEQALNNDKKK